MKLLTTVVITLLVIPTIVSSELTEKDLEKIREIVQTEVALIQKDMIAVELRLNEKIRESENRLQTQFSQSLDSRTNGIMIVFAVMSMGFFLLFTAILVVGALKNRQVDKKMIILMVLSLAGVLLCRISPVNAKVDKFGDIVCRSLTVVDRQDNKVAFLGKGLSYSPRKVSNIFEIYNEENGKKGIQLSVNSDINDIVMFDDNESSALTLRTLDDLSCFIQGSVGEKHAFRIDATGNYRGITLYDTSQTKTFQVDKDHVVNIEKEAFSVSVTASMNTLELWGISPYEKGIGFYADPNEARQTTWRRK